MCDASLIETYSFVSSLLFFNPSSFFLTFFLSYLSLVGEFPFVASQEQWWSCFDLTGISTSFLRVDFS